MTKLTTGERFMRLETKMESMHDDMNEIKKLLKSHIDREDARHEELDKRFVLIQQFAPVKSIVYGLVGLLLTGIVLAVITGVLK